MRTASQAKIAAAASANTPRGVSCERPTPASSQIARATATMLRTVDWNASRLTDLAFWTTAADDPSAGRVPPRRPSSALSVSRAARAGSGIDPKGIFNSASVDVVRLFPVSLALGSSAAETASALLAACRADCKLFAVLDPRRPRVLPEPTGKPLHTAPRYADARCRSTARVERA